MVEKTKPSFKKSATTPPTNPNAHPPTKGLRLSGFRIDTLGIHDRILRWRHFGYWQFAQTVRLEQSAKFLKLIFTFEGRKKPLTVDSSTSFAAALKMAAILEKGLIHSDKLVLDPQAQEFLEEANRFQTLKAAPTPETAAALKIAKAQILLRLADAKAARKEVKSLLEDSDENEEQARLIRLQTYFIEPDAILARVEYDLLAKRFPDQTKAPRLWAIWMLLKNETGSENFARETIRKSKTVKDRFAIQAHLVSFLTRHRNYPEAKRQIDEALLLREQLDSDQLQFLKESRKEIERLESDKTYHRRQTLWRPLLRKSIAFSILAAIALLFLGPAIYATPKLINDLQNLKKLEQSGLIAPTGKFDPNTRDQDFGFVRIFYSFNLQSEKPTRPNQLSFPTHYGSDMLRKNAAQSILADTRAHSVVYLPDSPTTCATYPISKENYIGTIAQYAPSYLFSLIILFTALFYTLQNLYKKIKYGAATTANPPTP